MAQTQTYATLLGRIEALFGASFGTTEKDRVESLVNRRAEMAYRESDYWENFLVIGEERSVDSSSAVVPYTGAVVDATAASTAANPYEGQVDTFMRVHRQSPWVRDTVNEVSFAGGGAGARYIGAVPSFGTAYTITAASALSGTVNIEIGSAVDFYVGGNASLEGLDTSGFPDINGTQELSAVNATSYIAGVTQIQFTITNTATYTWTLSGDETVKPEVMFATYKKRLNGTVYGENDTTDIPQEWFEYIAHGVMSDMLRADQQYEAAAMEEANANRALQQQLERIDRQHTSTTIGNRVATHGTEQGRQSTYQ